MEVIIVFNSSQLSNSLFCKYFIELVESFQYFESLYFQGITLETRFVMFAVCGRCSPGFVVLLGMLLVILVGSRAEWLFVLSS